MMKSFVIMTVHQLVLRMDTTPKYGSLARPAPSREKGLAPPDYKYGTIWTTSHAGQSLFVIVVTSCIKLNI